MLQHVGSLIATERQNQADSTDIVMLYMDTACRLSNRCNGNSGNVYPLRTIQGSGGTRTRPVEVLDEKTRSKSAIQGVLGGSITFVHNIPRRAQLDPEAPEQRIRYVLEAEVSQP